MTYGCFAVETAPALHWHDNSQTLHRRVVHCPFKQPDMAWHPKHCMQQVHMLCAHADVCLRMKSGETNAQLVSVANIFAALTNPI